MELRKWFWAALGLLAVAAGCDSPKKAEGGDHADRRQSRQVRQTAAVRRRPPTAAEKMAQIDRLMASCPDFDDRIGQFRNDLDRLARAASRVAALRPTLDEVNRLRSTSVNVMGRRVGVWVTICRLSPTADALNPVIAKVSEVVRRCEQIVRLKTIVASDYRIFKDYLARGRARPSEETLAYLRQAAGGLHTRIMLVERTWSDLDDMLAAMEGPLRAGRDALSSVTTAAVRDKAKEMAYRVGRVLAVTVSARNELREHRSRISKATETLRAISAG